MRDPQDERVLSIELSPDGRILKTVELNPRTPEPVPVALSHLRMSKRLNWQGSGSREDVQAFTDRIARIAEQVATRRASLLPITCFFDGHHYHIGSGYDQIMAAQRLHADVKAQIYAGSQQDAELFAILSGAATMKEVN